MIIKDPDLTDGPSTTTATSPIIDCTAANTEGNPSVNLVTGRVLYKFNDVTNGDGNYAITLNHIYNNQMPEAFSQKFPHFGKGWKLNWVQYLVRGEDSFTYYDENGDVHEFVWYAGDKYYDKSDAQIILEDKQTTLEITDGVGNKLEFDEYGKLIRSVSCQNANIVKTYVYSGSRLLRIYDQRMVVNGVYKSRIVMSYDSSGYLSKVVSYGNSDKKLFEISYTYTNGNLVSVSKQTFKNGSTGVSSEILRFSYDGEGGKLSSVCDCQTNETVMLQYSYQGRGVTKLSEGITKQTSATQSGQTAFVCKRYNDFYYGGVSNGLSTRTDVTNQDGVTISYFLDKFGRITSRFEKDGSNYKTLTKQGDKRIITQNGSMVDKINGFKAFSYSGEATLITQKTQICRNGAEQTCNRFNYSFWLKTTVRYACLEVKVTYKFVTESAEHTSTVYADGDAINAWQCVSLPIVAPTDSNGNVCTDITLLKIALVANKASCSHTFEFVDVGFRAAAHTQMQLRSGTSSFLPLSYVTKLYRKNSSGTLLEDSVSAGTFFTESDVMASFTNLNMGKEDFVVCNNGRQRLHAQAGYLSFGFASGVKMPISGKTQPFQVLTFLPQGGKLITTKYSYDSTKLSIQSISGSNSDNIAAFRQIDYTGKLLLERDEYGVAKKYYYDDEGNLLKTEHCASDGEVSGVDLYHYEDGKQGGYCDGLNAAELEYSNYHGKLSAIYDCLYDSQNGLTDTGIGHSLTYDDYTRPNKVNRLNIDPATYDETIVDSNTVTYADGRLNTVTDGKVTYGVTVNAETDTTEYCQITNGVSKAIQRDCISQSQDTQIYQSNLVKANGSETLLAKHTTDKFGHVIKTEVDGATHSYNYESSIAESNFAKSLQTVTDSATGITTAYKYDSDGNLTGWEESKGGQKCFEVSNTGDKTVYNFGNQLYFSTEVEYDSDKMVTPRVKGVWAGRKEGDGAIVFDKEAMFSQFVQYDKAGRVSCKYAPSVQNSDSKVDYYNYSYQKISGANGVGKTLLNKVTYVNNRTLGMLPTDADSFDVKQTENITRYPNGLVMRIARTQAWKYKYGSTQYNASANNFKAYIYDKFYRISSEQDKDQATYYSYIGQRLSGSSCYKKRLNKTFTYDGNLLTSVKTVNTTVTDGSYGIAYYSYDEYGNRTYFSEGKHFSGHDETIRAFSYKYGYGGKLKEIQQIGGNAVSFKYNHQGARIKKIVCGNEITYFTDGNKILAETYTPTDRQADEYDKTVYHYGLDGLTGFTRRDVKYVYVYDCEGNVSMIYRPGEYAALARYEYDAFGNCTVYDGNNQVNTQADFIGNVNPFRWKGHYYDVETGLYYIEGRYYDSTIGAYVDSSPVATVFDNAFVIGGLDRTGLLCNNPIELFVNPYNANTAMQLSMTEPPLTSDSTSTGIPWWHWLIGGVLIAGIFTAFAIATVATGGAAIAVGGLVGSVIGFGGSIVSQGLTKGFGNLNPLQLLLDTGLGAMSGMLGGSGISQTASAIFGAGLGFVGSAGSDLIAGQPVNFTRAALMSFVGGIIGAITGAGATNSTQFSKELANGFGLSDKQILAVGVSRLLSMNNAQQSMMGSISSVAIKYAARSLTTVSIGTGASISWGILMDLIMQFILER